jgi:hypothetical protein
MFSPLEDSQTLSVRVQIFPPKVGSRWHTSEESGREREIGNWTRTKKKFAIARVCAPLYTHTAQHSALTHKWKSLSGGIWLTHRARASLEFRLAKRSSLSSFQQQKRSIIFTTHRRSVIFENLISIAFLTASQRTRALIKYLALTSCQHLRASNTLIRAQRGEWDREWKKMMRLKQQQALFSAWASSAECWADLQKRG